MSGKKNKRLKAMCQKKATASNLESEANRTAEIEWRNSEAKRAAYLAAKKEKEFIELHKTREERLSEANKAESSKAALHRSRRHLPKVKSYTCTRCKDCKFEDFSGIESHQLQIHMRGAYEKMHNEICKKCGNCYPRKGKLRGKHVCNNSSAAQNDEGGSIEDDDAYAYSDGNGDYAYAYSDDDGDYA